MNLETGLGQQETNLTPKQQFSGELFDLLDDINSARCHFEIWMALRFDIPAAAQNIMPCETRIFVRLSRFAHYKCMIIDLFKLLDSHPGSASLRNVLKDSSELKIIRGEAHANCCQLISSMEPVWKKIRVLRHKLFAHTEKHVNYDQLMAEQDLLAKDFEEFLENALSTVAIIEFEADYFEPMLQEHSVVPSREGTFGFERNFYRKQTKQFIDSVIEDARSVAE